MPVPEDAQPDPRAGRRADECLRIGGDSSDHTFYDPDLRRLPHWAFELTPTFVERTARIVNKLHLRVIIDLNLITGTPLEAGAWAHAAVTEMPKGSVLGFEIGNEPDLPTEYCGSSTSAGRGSTPASCPRP